MLTNRPLSLFLFQDPLFLWYSFSAAELLQVFPGKLGRTGAQPAGAVSSSQLRAWLSGGKAPSARRSRRWHGKLPAFRSLSAGAGFAIRASPNTSGWPGARHVPLSQHLRSSHLQLSTVPQAKLWLEVRAPSPMCPLHWLFKQYLITPKVRLVLTSWGAARSPGPTRARAARPVVWLACVDLSVPTKHAG